MPPHPTSWMSILILCSYLEKSKHYYVLRVLSRVAQIFQKNQEHLEILGASWVPCSKCLIVDPKILGVTVKNLVAWDLCPFFEFLGCDVHVTVHRDKFL